MNTNISPEELFQDIQENGLEYAKPALDDKFLFRNMKNVSVEEEESIIKPKKMKVSKTSSDKTHTEDVTSETSVKRRGRPKKDLTKTKSTIEQNRESSEDSVKIKKLPKNMGTLKDIQEPDDLPNATVRVIPLGGIGEIGKNITVIETEYDIVVIDCGLSFPDQTQLGVDSIVPKLDYLVENRNKIRGLIITHAHEDHIGAVIHLLRMIDIPVYATRFTIGVLGDRVREAIPALKGMTTFVVKSGNKVRLGTLDVEFIKVNHSIPGAVAVAIHTPAGVIIHTGDFKIDTTPVNSSIIDLAKFGEYGKKGVSLLLADSTNSERSGWTQSEKAVETELYSLFEKYPDKRITVATFSSNVYRMQSAIKAALAFGRKIAIAGKSMIAMFNVAVRLGYLKVPQESLIDVDDVAFYPKDEIAIIMTGSQGEPFAVLSRIANGEHKYLSLDEDDVVILSSHAVPGNEKSVSMIVNKLAERKVEVVGDINANVHVSGHACREELKMLHALIRPKYFMPVHGERRHLLAHKQIALDMGMDENNIFLTANGRVLELTRTSATLTNEIVDNGTILIDNNFATSVYSPSEQVLKDRKVMANCGCIMISCTVDIKNKKIISKAEVLSRGFVDNKEYEVLFRRLKSELNTVLENTIHMEYADVIEIKKNLRNAAADFAYQTTKDNPVVVVFVQEGGNN